MTEVVEQSTDQAVNPEEKNTQEVVKTYTQDEVNGLVTKESRKAQEKIFKSLGFDDINSAKDGLSKLKEWQESQKSESEKQAEALASKEKELESYIQLNKALESQLAALKLGVTADSVDDVIALAERIVSDEVSIDDAISQVLSKYPQFGNSTPNVEKSPTITVGGNPAADSSSSKTDPFQAVLNGYKK